MCRRRIGCRFERLDRCGYENEAIQLESLVGIDGDEQVAEVRRIEASAEDPEPHGSGDCRRGAGRGHVGDAVASLPHFRVVRVLLTELSTEIRRVFPVTYGLVGVDEPE